MGACSSRDNAIESSIFIRARVPCTEQAWARTGVEIMLRMFKWLISQRSSRLQLSFLAPIPGKDQVTFVNESVESLRQIASELSSLRSASTLDPEQITVTHIVAFQRLAAFLTAPKNLNLLTRRSGLRWTVPLRFITPHTLSPELPPSAITKLYEIFAKIDKQNQGEIDESDLDRWISKVPSYDSVCESVYFPLLFSIPVVERDGYLSAPEFITAIDRLCTLSRRQLFRLAFAYLARIQVKIPNFYSDEAKRVYGNVHQVFYAQKSGEEEEPTHPQYDDILEATSSSFGRLDVPAHAMQDEDDGLDTLGMTNEEIEWHRQLQRARKDADREFVYDSSGRPMSKYELRKMQERMKRTSSSVQNNNSAMTSVDSSLKADPSIPTQTVQYISLSSLPILFSELAEAQTDRLHVSYKILETIQTWRENAQKYRGIRNSEHRENQSSSIQLASNRTSILREPRGSRASKVSPDQSPIATSGQSNGSGSLSGSRRSLEDGDMEEELPDRKRHPAYHRIRNCWAEIQHRKFAWKFLVEETQAGRMLLPEAPKGRGHGKKSRFTRGIDPERQGEEEELRHADPDAWGDKADEIRQRKALETSLPAWKNSVVVREQEDKQMERLRTLQIMCAGADDLISWREFEEMLSSSVFLRNEILKLQDAFITLTLGSSAWTERQRIVQTQAKDYRQTLRDTMRVSNGQSRLPPAGAGSKGASAHLQDLSNVPFRTSGSPTSLPKHAWGYSTERRHPHPLENPILYPSLYGPNEIIIGRTSEQKYFHPPPGDVFLPGGKENGWNSTGGSLVLNGNGIADATSISAEQVSVAPSKDKSPKDAKDTGDGATPAASPVTPRRDTFFLTSTPLPVYVPPVRVPTIVKFALEEEYPAEYCELRTTDKPLGAASRKSMSTIELDRVDQNSINLRASMLGAMREEDEEDENDEPPGESKDKLTYLASTKSLSFSQSFSLGSPTTPVATPTAPTPLQRNSMPLLRPVSFHSPRASAQVMDTPGSASPMPNGLPSSNGTGLGATGGLIGTSSSNRLTLASPLVPVRPSWGGGDTTPKLDSGSARFLVERNSAV